MKTTKTFLAAAFAMASCLGMADYMYWQVSDAIFATPSRADANFAYATVRTNDGNGEGADINDHAEEYYRLYTIDNGVSTATDQYKFYSDVSNPNSTEGGAQLFGAFDSNVNSFLFELWNADGTLVGYSNRSRSDLSYAIYSSPDTVGGHQADYRPFVLKGVVPEPTSGLLLLLGVAGLALRRRRRAVCGVVAALACCSAFAAANDALISFSTKGVDRYADGSAVIDGECYALVWTAAGSDGAAIAADGSVKGGEIVLTAPVAKGGRCPTVMFEVAADDIETKYKNGTWGVYLLDTRRYGADGSVTLAGASGGRPVAVNAAGMVAGSSVKLSSGGISDAAVAAAASASSATAVPEGTPRPEITGIRVDGANVFVTVRGTVPHLAYGLKSGETPSEVTESAGAPRSGEESGEITLVAPVKKGGEFFKVERR